MKYELMLKRLNKRLKAKGFTRKYLAQQLYCSEVTCYKKLAGTSSLKIEDIWKLCELLKLSDTDILQLFFRRGNNNE